jgi:valyl-tRNA synthetase
LFNSYLPGSVKANLRSNFEPEKATGVEVVRGVGLVYYKFDNGTQKDIQILKNDLKEFMEFELKRAEGKLSNTKFVENADKDLVEAEKEKISFYSESLKLI